MGLGSSNRGRYSSTAVDEALAKAVSTTDDEKRARLLAEATAIAINDAGVIPLYFPLNSWAARANLKVTPRSDEFTLPWEIVPR